MIKRSIEVSDKGRCYLINEVDFGHYKAVSVIALGDPSEAKEWLEVYKDIERKELKADFKGIK